MAALEAAKAFRAQLVNEGILSEKSEPLLPKPQRSKPQQPKPYHPKIGFGDRKVRGVYWTKSQTCMVQINASKNRIYGGKFGDKAAAVAKAVELHEQHRALWTLPMFQPKVPDAGVTWEQRSQQ